MQSGSERSETQPSAESFAGVPLVQLAAVAAARAEGFSLEEILNTEGLEPSAYRAADVAYKGRLVDPAQRERLSVDYQNELARAEDRLGRKVSPIDEDVDAWVRFLGTYGTQSAPADWLTALGMTLPDLSRLSRTWKQRLDADEALRKRAEKSARDKKPYDVASLRVSPAKLVPSPLAKPLEKPALANTAPFPTTPAPVVKRWMPRVEPIAETPAVPAAPPNMGMAFDFLVKPVAPSPLAATSPAFSLPNEDVLPFVAGPEIPDDPPTREEELAALAPPREALSGTSLALDIPRGPATPFAAKSPAAIPEKPKPIELPKVQPAPTGLSGTSLMVDIPRGPATPFIASDEPSDIEEKPVEKKLPEVKPAPAALGGTSLAVDIPRGPAMPFAPAKDAPTIDEKPKVQEKPIVQRPPAELSGTSFSLDIPRGPAMPFAPAKGAPTIEEKPKVQEKPIVQRPPAELSGTSFSLDIPRGPAMPFVEAKPKASREEPAPKPAAPSPVPKEEKPAFKPLLSLEQHAALSVEIATYPAHALAILKRYGITPPQKVDLDQHYQRIVGSDPAKQAAWHAAYSAHYAALMRTPRR